jgi:hypothetical protein
VWELGKSFLETALADETPRAGDIGPDVNVHKTFK